MAEDERSMLNRIIGRVDDRCDHCRQDVHREPVLGCDGAPMSDLTFDAVDYLHAFADDASGCTPTASKSIHAIAGDYERLLAELQRTENDLAVAVQEARFARETLQAYHSQGPYSEMATQILHQWASLNEDGVWP